MTDGTYVGTRPVAPPEENYSATQQQALEVWPQVTEWIAGIERLKRVFLIGAGGSFVGLTALQYQLDRAGTTPSTHLNPAELMARAPRAIDEESAVLLLSGAGTTPETVDAAKWAVGRGAHVAAVTMGEESPLAAAVPTVFLGHSGEGNQMILQLVGLAVLQHDGVDVSAELGALHALPTAIDAAVEAFEPRAEQIAETMKDVPVTYLLASGPLVGPGNTFTSCFLQEMQWMHAATLNANDFFQGPFEVFDKDTKCILFLGEDETRPMGQRAQKFLEKYSGETVIIDAKDLVLPGIATEQRAFVAPVVFYTLMFRLAAYYSATRGYTLEGRRYMWQFDY